MPVVSKLQSGFTSGELDPKLRARNDLASYNNGAAKMRNVLVIPQGAAIRRPGMEYMGYLPSGTIQMIPFTFSAEEHYICVLSVNLLSIYKEGQFLTSVACTISETQIPTVTYAQSYDTLILFHTDWTPQAFIRASEASWSNSDWLLTNIPSRNFGAAATTSIRITKNGVTNIDFSLWVTGNTEEDTFFTTADDFWIGPDTDWVGKYIRAGGGYAKITSVDTAKRAIGIILAPYTNDTKTDQTDYAAGEWGVEEEVWSTTRGWPACGAFFQGRLYMAHTADLPSTLWGSIVKDETNFQNWIPEYDDNGLEISAGGGLVSNFQRIHSGQHLMVLGDTGEFYIPSSKQEPITPLKASLVRNSSYGSVNLPTYEIDGAVVYLREGGKSLIQTKFNFADGSYINRDLSLLSSHLLNDPKSMAYRKQSNTDEADYVLVVNGDGTLSVLCILTAQEVTAWTVCETEGEYVATVADGSVMYFAVDRVINEVAVRTLERFNLDLLLDCATLAESPVLIDVMTGLDHLDGEDVAIVLDNTVQPSQTVVDGEITLARSGYDVQAGLEFPIVDTTTGSHVYVETMPIEVDLGTGTSVGKRKRVIEATVMLYETSHAIVSKNDVTIRRIGVDHLDSPVPKRSENLKIQGLLGWSDEVQVSVGQTIPLPMQLLGLAYRVRV
jgi:hypothetical protein